MKGTYEMLPNVGKHRFTQDDGSFRWLVPGDQVTCYPDDLCGVMHKFRVVSEPPPPTTMLAGLALVQRSPGWFDVVNPATGVKINSSALRKEDALELIGDAGTTEDADDGDEQETFGPDGASVS